ncbi:molecular chaperone DnaJ [Clostridia bacterium]|nr:molecular chaperone DnaJ [Clostridia bacterium]
MTINYFVPTPTNIETLKKMYHALAMEHHPDMGGNLDIMKAINNQFENLFTKLKDIHVNAAGEEYTKESTDTADEYQDTVNALIALHMTDVLIEVIGSFIWISGNTKPYKDNLKEMGFKWSQNKTSWYLAPATYKKRSRQTYTLESIRDMYGSKTVNTADNKPKNAYITA